MSAISESQVVLGIDTATVVNVGLAAGNEVLAVATVSDPRAHAEQLLPQVRRCLTDAGCRLADVDHLVVGMGPGPFTGLRVGIATAQILSTAGSIPLHGICSLDVLAVHYATHWVPEDGFVVATDARRREVYWAAYAPSGARLAGPHVGPPAEVPKMPVIGPAAEVYPDRLLIAPGPRSLDPGVLASMGRRLPSVGGEPLYLRRADAAEPTRRKSVLVRRSAARLR
jgi:tRNA threonylcarbamoyl adenosine modification protein YeaZ